MKQTGILRLIAALLAILVAGIGLVYTCSMLGPFDYLGIAVPRVLYGIPLVLAVLGYFLCTWRTSTVHEKRKRFVEYGVRFGIFLVVCAVGFFTAFAYRGQNVEFIPVQGSELGFEQGVKLEQTLGFKVGMQSGYHWQRVFFKRVPGRAEKVREAMQQQTLNAKAVNLSK